MSTLTRTTNPVAEMLTWLEADAPIAFRGLGLSGHVRVEDFIEDGVYVLRAEMPGIDPDKDVEVTIDGDVLTMKGERSEEEKTKNRHEFHYGAFARSVTLPHGAKKDDVKASYTDGVLEIRVPMNDEEPQARKVPVQRAEG